MNMFKSNSEEENDWADESLIESCGKLLLRITIGGLMLFHGIAKVLGGIDPIKEMLDAQGMPTVFAYGVYVGELVAPILIVIGLWTRLSAFVFVFNMIVAIGLGHACEILVLGEFGEWAIELPMLYLLGALVIALIGPGNLAIGKKIGLLA